MNTILGFIQQAQDELIDELSIKVDQLDKCRLGALWRDSGRAVRLVQIHVVGRSGPSHRTVQTERKEIRGRALGRGAGRTDRKTSAENTGGEIIEECSRHRSRRERGSLRKVDANISSQRGS